IRSSWMVNTETDDSVGPLGPVKAAPTLRCQYGSAGGGRHGCDHHAEPIAAAFDPALRRCTLHALKLHTNAASRRNIFYRTNARTAERGAQLAVADPGSGPPLMAWP